MEPIFYLRTVLPEKVDVTSYFEPGSVAEPKFAQMSVIIETDYSPVLYPHITEALNQLEDLQEFDVENVYNIIQAGSSIAKESRRGLGNVIYTNDLHDAFSKLPENYTIVFGEDFPGTILVYQGNSKHMDGAILHTEQGFAVHPDYKRLARKLNFK